MAEVDKVYLLGEGGGIHTFDVDKLDERFTDRLARGELRRVNEDGSPFVDEPDEPRLTPKQKLQADAEQLGLSTDGTVDELKARIDAKLAEPAK